MLASKHQDSVYIRNRHGEALMPCSPAKARHLLKQGKATVIRARPFTLKLRHGSSGYRQEIVAGMDTGSKTIGVAAIGNGRVLYQAEVKLRDDITGKMEQRACYRRTRRSRKTRYRPARWNNRASRRKAGRLAPSIRSKVDSHLRERTFIESILPITRWKVELASFDIHKITNPDLSGTGYQNGPLKDYYNTKAYVLHRDGYRCQSKQKGIKHSKELHVHHILFRSQNGSDAPTNLITLCKTCHDDLHAGKFQIKGKRSRTKAPTETGIIKGAIANSGWTFEATFGYQTKFKREQHQNLPKSHANDAIAICCEDGAIVTPHSTLWKKRHVAAGDYRQTKGAHSQIRIPTGKLFDLRKFDLIQTEQGSGFVKGKRSTGYFALSDIDDKPVHASAKVLNCQRLAARSTTLIQGQRLLPAL
jgi:hypothetical protein